MRINIMLITLLGLILFVSCRKEEKQDSVSLLEPLSGQKTSLQDLDNFATYNATYNVLEFANFADVANLEQALGNYSKTYPFDQGNTVPIFERIVDIGMYGYTDRVPPMNGQININDFESLLLNSYPLSDSVMLAIIELNEQITPKLPDSFMESVLTANVPFSYEVMDSVKNSSIGQTNKNAIIAAHDNVYVIPDLVYDDFLSFYPSYNSLYEERNADEETKLRNGLDPGATGFFPADFDNRFLSLILNTDKEIFVEGHLIKLYNDCRTVVIQNSIGNAYSQLSLLDQNGLDTPPTNISETTAGVAISVMNQSFPMDYAIIDLNNIDFDGDSPTDPIGLDSYDSYEVFGCPQASFSYGWESANDFEVTFTNLTDLFFPGNTIYHYWQFGDGTGSFQASPKHEYNNPGTYTVKLTAFTADCGCWDVQTLQVIIPDPAIGGTKACYCSVAVDVQGVLDETGIVEFNVYAFDDTDPFAQGVVYHWDFGDGLFAIDTSQTGYIQHYYPYAGTYTGSLWVELSNQCYTAKQEFVVNVPNDDPDICCDKRQNMASQTWEFSYNGTNNYKLKTNDSYVGNGIFGDKIHGCQKLYRKKDNGHWTGQKGRQEVYIDAIVYLKNTVTGQKCFEAHHIVDFDNTLMNGSGNDKQAFDFPCFQDPFGVVQANTIQVYHRVYVSYPNGYFQKIIVFGEQNCD